MASSSYFTKKLKENPDITILELSDCPASAVRDLIDYLYTSRLNITQDGARDLLSVAVRLELASAQHAVEMFLRMRMTTPIAIQTLRVSSPLYFIPVLLYFPLPVSHSELQSGVFTGLVW